MQLGDKDTKRMIKKKFDLANARQRDPMKAMSHSYKSKLTNPITTSQKWKEQKGSVNNLGASAVTNKGMNGLGAKLPKTPMLVQY